MLPFLTVKSPDLKLPPHSQASGLLNRVFSKLGDFLKLGPKMLYHTTLCVEDWALPMRVRDGVLDVVVICMTLALCVLCTGTCSHFTEGAILND